MGKRVIMMDVPAERRKGRSKQVGMLSIIRQRRDYRAKRYVATSPKHRPHTKVGKMLMKEGLL